MAPKIVNKEEKRQEIANLSYEYLLEVGIENFSTDGLIKHLKIGKSSLYHYFKSKDEIIHEIMKNLNREYFEYLNQYLHKNMSLKHKLQTIYYTYLDESKENIEVLKLLKEFYAVYEHEQTELVKQSTENYFHKMQDVLREVLEEEIQKKRIKPEAINLVNTILTTADGMLIYSLSLESFNLSSEFNTFIDSFCELVKV